MSSKQAYSAPLFDVELAPVLTEIPPQLRSTTSLLHAQRRCPASMTCWGLVTSYERTGRFWDWRETRMLRSARPEVPLNVLQPGSAQGYDHNL